MDDFDLFTYPHRPGFTEPTTSREAAHRIEPRAGTLRATVLLHLRWHPATADEVALALGESVLSVRPRVTELYKLGLIVRTGVVRRNSSGMNAHEYRIVR